MNKESAVIEKYESQTGGDLIFSNGKTRFNFGDFINGRLKKNGRQVLVKAGQIKNLFLNRFLNSLPDEEFARLLQHLEAVSLSEGEKICAADETFKYVYFPENALFSQFHILQDGRMNEIVMTGREGVVGFSEIIGSNPPKFWTQISISGNALRIKTSIFEREFEKGGALQSALLDYLNIYIREISQKAVCNNYHLAEERLCCWLLNVRDRVGSDHLQLTHEQIASYLGVNRPSITRITKTLRDEGIIHYVRGSLTIKDHKKLEANACDCYLKII